MSLPLFELRVCSGCCQPWPPRPMPVPTRGDSTASAVPAPRRLSPTFHILALSVNLRQPPLGSPHPAGQWGAKERRETADLGFRPSRVPLELPEPGRMWGRQPSPLGWGPRPLPGLLSRPL